MSRRLTCALIIIALSVVVLIANSRGMSSNVSVDLLFTTVTGLKSIIFLIFVGVGVFVGILLR